MPFDEHINIKPVSGGIELYKGLKDYFDFYNENRLQQSLKYQTPKQVFDQQVEAA